MVIKVSFYSYFKDLTGCSQTTADLPAPSSVSDLLANLSERFPKLAAMRKSMLVAVGVDYQPHNYILKESDEVALFPPVQGG